jgi:hypothetical protein
MTNDSETEKPYKESEILFIRGQVKIEDNYIRNGLLIMGGLLFSLYVTTGISTGAWTPKQIKAYNERVRIEQELKDQHLKEVNYFYNRLFEKAITFQDSVEIYKKYNLPINIKNPTLNQKEKAIKQNELERSLK